MRALRIGALAALGLAAAAPVAAWAMDRFLGVTVQPVTPAAPEAVALNRTLHEKGQSVAEIYGIPSGRKMRVLFPKEGSLVRPAEDPSVRLLLIDKQRGDNPLQVKTLWFVAWRAGAGLAALGLAGLLASLLVARRRRFSRA
ncbi:MAG: hypothetical protein RBU30_27580 [Polyangia bacterium]|jgi:hypothetical protein|nr:hypothetical protein [Polyangia bacterium]